MGCGFIPTCLVSPPGSVFSVLIRRTERKKMHFAAKWSIMVQGSDML
ncbi:hypothetical protein HMPREF3213_01762 [Heyndrickxia coagulans]|uniref:Uncharacterized protein n=1 Tax=Heyndrickxia coagulans TaxID=1398 RepID=A0A133KS26_HEYCO|nr:hypothetical protein HMPREF3213_01762 [Heyndrickxia coagulans]